MTRVAATTCGKTWAVSTWAPAPHDEERAERPVGPCLERA